TTDNDQAVFIGSSNIADGAGRQVWNFRDGNLGGDRRHKLKVYGYYQFDWDARAGAFLMYQSGEPWEAWNDEYYWGQTGSTSTTIKNAEPAGSRTTDAHVQLDLNYTQNFRVAGDQNIQVRVDIYNVLDKQTGYNPTRDQGSPSFGTSNSYYMPRSLQLAVKYQF
ncbi:MAG: carboxypeptidase regulatory-like domain-containing protein, partial [Gammaproteobacteria bacterium]|nr:carboxypeptidase regulatory-like domain-containing protein [Gammaproteobacteria bacterium]